MQLDTLAADVGRLQFDSGFIEAPGFGLHQWVITLQVFRAMEGAC